METAIGTDLLVVPKIVSNNLKHNAKLFDCLTVKYFEINLVLCRFYPAGTDLFKLQTKTSIRTGVFKLSNKDIEMKSIEIVQEFMVYVQFKQFRNVI